MQPHPIVSRQQWIAARKTHLDHEKEFTRARDRLSESARRCPGSRSTRPTCSTGLQAQGDAGRSVQRPQPARAVQHSMFAPNSEPAACKSCSFWADGFERMVPHLAARDTTLVAVSRAPLAKLRRVQGADGLDVRLVSIGRQRFQLPTTRSRLRPRRSNGRQGL